MELSKSLNSIKKDVFGGLTAGIIALPLALAFGVASGLGASAGLYGAIILCFFATLFGGTPTQISGPTGPMTVVIASIAALYHDNPAIVFFTIFLAGIFQIIFGISKIGKFVHYVPYPVISGFMSGIGVIIILLQINPLMGLTSQGTPVDSVISLLKSLSDINFESMLIGMLTLIIVFFTPKFITKRIPSPLIALLLLTPICAIMNLNINTIGEIPSSLPSLKLHLIHYKEIVNIIPVALTIAVLGSIDSLLTSLVADSITKTKHNSNRELIGQGIGNTIAGVFGGLAGSGATMRTVINIKSGGHTRLSGVVHSIFLICVVLFFAPYTAKIPLAVLAGILIKVGFDIIDYKFIKLIKAAPKSDLSVMIIVFLITIFDDLIFAVGAGIVLSSILFAVNISKQFDVNIKHISDEDDTIEEDEAKKIMILHIKGILFFGSASQLISRTEGLFDNNCVIIDCQEIEQMDISAVFALEEIILRLKDKKIKVILILNNRKLAGQVLRLGLIKLISKDDIVFEMGKACQKANLHNTSVD